VGFRIITDGASVAYLPDHEPALAGGFDDRTRDWISGGSIAEDVDLLLHDAQYFEDEYDARVGWGHSSVSSAVAYADALGVKRLVLFHHDPTHSDDTMQKLEAEARALVDGDEDPPTIAREGMVLDL
jgi:ribonuclease BN (tRNA processing enzyme)